MLAGLGKWAAHPGKHFASFPVPIGDSESYLNLKDKTSKEPGKTHGKQALWHHRGPTLAHFCPNLIHFGGYAGPP